MTKALAAPSGFHGAFLSDDETIEAFSHAAGPYHIPPWAVAEPTDTEDVVRLVEWASAEGVPLIPRGAATGMPAGNVGPGVVVDMTHWTRLGTVDPEARTVTVQPGAAAARVAHAAQGRGLRFPPLPSSADRCTVGGMVANNAAGAASFAHGSVRDWLSSAQVVLADGTVLRVGHSMTDRTPFAGLRSTLRQHLGDDLPGWPAVRKNSSGYGLDRFVPEGDALALLAGSEGTLGILTELTLRLAPTAPGRALTTLAVSDLGGLTRGIAAAGRAGAASCEFLGRSFLDLAGLRKNPDTAAFVDGAEALLMMEFEGDPGHVEHAVELLRAHAGDERSALRVARTPAERDRAWAVRHAASPALARAAGRGKVPMQFIEDSVVPPPRLEEYLVGLEGILRDEHTEAAVFGHAGDGNVHVNPLVDVRRPDWRDRVRRILLRTADLVAALGGTLTGEHGDGRLRAPLLDRVWPTDLVAAFRITKDALDPRGILNPGVILPLEGQDPLHGIRAPDAAA